MPLFDLPSFQELRSVAAQQNGVLASEQLEEHGVSLELAKARVDAGRWQRPQRRVFAVFSGGVDRQAVIWAALLRCGRDAVASHETAAELDGLGEQCEDELIHVTIGAGRNVRGRLPGIRLHYAHRLPETRHPARMPPRTRVEDTVLDIVDTSRSARYATRWVAAAIQERKTTVSRLAERLASRKKIKWRSLVESMLLDVAEGAESMLEVEHLRRVERAHCLPTGVRQRRVAGVRVIWIDVDYDEFATRVELDGRVGHADEASKFRDRKRDNRGTVGDRWTLRYGHAEVFGTPCAVAAEQAFVLRQRGWLGTPKSCGDGCGLRAELAGLAAHRRPP